MIYGQLRIRYMRGPRKHMFQWGHGEQVVMVTLTEDEVDYGTVMRMRDQFYTNIRRLVGSLNKGRFEILDFAINGYLD